MAIHERRHSELLSEDHRLAGPIDEQNRCAVASVVCLALLVPPTAISASIIEVDTSQRVPGVGEHVDPVDAYVVIAARIGRVHRRIVRPPCTRIQSHRLHRPHPRLV
jgi:hypothetical protein